RALRARAPSAAEDRGRGRRGPGGPRSRRGRRAGGRGRPARSTPRAGRRGGHPPRRGAPPRGGGGRRRGWGRAPSWRPTPPRRAAGDLAHRLLGPDGLEGGVGAVVALVSHGVLLLDSEPSAGPRSPL